MEGMYQEPFEEWDHKLISSSRGELKGQKRYYRVSYGTSQWHTSDPGKMHPSITVFVQFGEEKDFKIAKRKKELKMDYPCHFLEEDMDNIIAAMKNLKEEYSRIND